MSLIAVRRNIQANAMFYEQRGDAVYYSLDKVNWLYGWTLPSTLAQRGSFSYQKYLNQYYRNQIITNIINPPQDPPPTRRTDIKEQIEEVEERRVSNRAICAAIKLMLQTLNEAARLARDEEITPLQTTVQNASIIIAAAAALAGIFISGGAALPLVGAAVATRLASDVGFPLVLANMPDLSDEQIDEATCAIYANAKNGNIDYETMRDLNPIPGLNWSELYTPEMHAAFLAMVEQQAGENAPCECEECYEFLPVNTVIQRGEVFNKSLLTVDTIVSGGLRQMEAIVNIPLDAPLIVQKVTVSYAMQTYENVNGAPPYIRYEASDTGGGNTAITNGFKTIELDPAHFGFLGTSAITLRLVSSLCSACSTAQLATYNESYGLLVWVEICGVAA